MSLIKEDHLFAEIALLNKFITKEQLEEVKYIQKTKECFSTLGRLLLRKDYINILQFRQILDTQKKNLPKPAITNQEKREDTIFSYLAVKNHYVDEEEVYSALYTQSKMSRRGLLFRLSELLVNKCFLTINQAEKILGIQDKFIVSCIGCNLRYNILGLQVKQFVCKKCQRAIKIPEEIFTLYNMNEIELFQKKIESIAKNKNRKTKPVEKRPTVRSKDSLKIISGSFISTIEELNNEDNCNDEVIDFTCGVSHTREEEDIKELDFDDFIVAGKINSKKLLEEQSDTYYKNILNLGEKTSSEDFIFDDLTQDDIIGISLSSKKK